MRHSGAPSPEPDSLSFLMSAPGISDAELGDLGVEIVERIGGGIRCLRIPGSSLEAYQELIAEKLQPGFWNEIVGRAGILFLFKLADGSVRRLACSPETQPEISRLCSLMNGDPIEKTSDLPRYLAANPFYRDAMVEWHGAPRE